MESRKISGEPGYEPTLRHLVREIDGAGKAQGIRAPVTLDRDAVEAKERAPVIAARVHFRLEDAKTARSQQRAQPRNPRACHGGPQILAYLLGGAFRGLQRNVAGKALDHHHVD